MRSPDFLIRPFGIPLLEVMMSGAAVLGFVKPDLIVNGVILKQVHVDCKRRRNVLKHLNKGYVRHRWSLVMSATSLE